LPSIQDLLVIVGNVAFGRRGLAMRLLGLCRGFVFVSVPLAVCGQVAATARARTPDPVYLIIHSDAAVAVGMRRTLNSERRNNRWELVSGREAVPTLVAADGCVFQSAEALYQNHPDLRQPERELRAQIERALRSRVACEDR
jgi:hypothetical protein